MVQTVVTQFGPKIWRLNVANKIKVFIWRACHNFLPSALILLCRKIATSANCLRCGHPKESTIHALWECKEARQVWKHTFLHNVYKEWKEPNFIELFSHVDKEFSKPDLELFAVIAWWIWNNRNDAKIGKIPLRGELLVGKAQDWLQDFATTHMSSPKVSPLSQVVEQHVKWWPPKEQFVKLNVDAAFTENIKRTGFGAVIRNENGLMLDAKMEAIHGKLSVFAAEAYAILIGMRICAQEGYMKVEIESDAFNVIQAITTGGWNLSPEGAIFDEIKLLADHLEDVKWKKIPRLCNGVAHSLAKAAIPVIGPIFWKEVGPLGWKNYYLMISLFDLGV